jgi:hypothetical protein
MAYKEEELKRMLKHAQSLRATHETEMADAYRYTYPAREFNIARNTNELPDRTAIWDNTAGAAVRNLATNTVRLLIPQNQQWAEANWRTRELERLFASQYRRELRQLNLDLHKHFVDSNFYMATSTALIDAIVAGTMCLMFVDIPDQPLDYMAVPIEQIYFLEDHSEQVNAVFREHELEARNVVERFPDAPEKVTQQADENPTQKICIIECCYQDGSKWQYQVYTRDGWDKLTESKSDHNPFVIARWEKSLGNVWGESWVRAALPGIRTANGLVRNTMKFGEYAAFGLWQTDDDSFNTENLQDTLTPGNIVITDQSMPLVPVQFPGNFQLSLEMVNAERGQIKSQLHDTSLPNDEALKYMTAEAVTQRRAEFMRLVGEPAQRLQREYLQPIAEQALDRLTRRGDLNVFSNAAVKALGVSGLETQADLFRMDVNAAVARANRMADTLDSINAFVQLAQIVGPQQLALHVDTDMFTRESLEGLGFRADLLRDPRQVEQIKQQQAQAAQAEQAMSAAQAAGESLTEALGKQRPSTGPFNSQV